MARPPKPDFLVAYEKFVTTPPKCCHTCDHFGSMGDCMIYHMQPPAEFVNSEGQCEAYERELPF